MRDPSKLDAASGAHPADRIAVEHQVVLAVLDAMDVEVARLRGEGHVQAARWRDFLDLLLGLVHEAHQAKEGLLFDAMAAQGFPRDPGPIAALEHDHRDADDLLDQVRGALAAGDGAALARAARNYADFLRDHIAREDNVLLPLARQVVRGDAADELLARLARFDAELVTADETARRLHTARRLCDSCGVDLDRDRHPPFDGRCGHSGSH